MYWEIYYNAITVIDLRVVKLNLDIMLIESRILNPSSPMNRF